MPTMTAAERVERRKQATNLRLAGATLEAITIQCGYSSKRVAWKDVQTGLNDLAVPSELADENQQSLARLDAMLLGLWPYATKGNDKAVGMVLRIENKRRELLEEIAANNAAKDENDQLGILLTEHNSSDAE